MPKKLFGSKFQELAVIENGKILCNGCKNEFDNESLLNYHIYEKPEASCLRVWKAYFDKKELKFPT